MLVKLLKAQPQDGKKVGDVWNVPQSTASFLIGRGEAVYTDGKIAPEEFAAKLRKKSERLLLNRQAKRIVEKLVKQHLGRFLKEWAAKGDCKWAEEEGYVQKTALATTSGTVGGYLLTAWMATLLTAIPPAIVRRFAQKTTSDKFNPFYPTIDMTTVQAAGTSAFAGGMKFVFNADDSTVTASQPALKQLELRPQNQNAYLLFSRALWDDMSEAGIVSAFLARIFHEPVF